MTAKLIHHLRSVCKLVFIGLAASLLAACATQREPGYVTAFNANLKALAPINYDAPPIIRRSIAIAYPGVRLQEKEEGYARLSFVINDRGRATDFNVLEASHPAFAGYLIMRLGQWRFHPATRDGQPVSQRFAQRFDFKLGSQRAVKQDRIQREQRDRDGPRVVDPSG